MRRFSSRNSLVTLNEINITPLLDLAFVLLIIFIITTPLLENSLELNLPVGSRASPDLKREDIRTVEISARGDYTLGGRRLPLNQIVFELSAARRVNPNLVIYIRADREGKNKDTYALIDACLRNGMERYSLRTEPVR